jgi:hypothetical protein
MATTTPNYGWDVPTSTDYVKDGATAIENLGDDIDSTLYTALGGAYPGLRLVKKQTIGSAVSSVVVSDAFSATYDAYKIIITGGSASATNYLKLQLGASTSGYDESLLLAPYASAFLKASNTSQPSFSYAGNHYSGQAIFLNADLVNPFLAKFTTITTSSGGQVETAFGLYGGVHKVATSYSAFTLIPTSGTLTGGTIYVYGYGAS